MNPETAPRARRAPAVLLGVLALAAGAFLNPLSVGALLAEDGSIGGGIETIAVVALELLLFAFGTLILLRPVRLRWHAGTLLTAAVLALIAAAGLVGLRRATRGAPWEEPGLSMPARLTLLAERDARTYFYGGDPDELRGLIREHEAEGQTLRAFSARQELADALLRRGEFAEATAVLEDILVRLEGVQSRRRERYESDVRNALVGTYLRWGEVENCIANHNSDSCLLPIAGGGVHTKPFGSRKALALLEEMLAGDPEDLLARWLLNLAAMTLGEYPDGVREDWRIPPEIFASEVEFPRYLDVAPGLGLAVSDLAGGSVLEDLDGDGDLDLVSSGMGRDDQLRFFRNEGDGSFVERTQAAGLEGLTGGLNLSHADYDNDGAVDVLVLRGAWKGPTGGLPNSLLRNEGDGTFRDVTEEAGMLAVRATSAGAWGDYDNDGWLDLFLTNESRDTHPLPNRLMRNQGDGTFEDEIAGSGIEPFGFSKGAAWGDYDDDGLPDLYVSRRYSPNSLYRNRGDGTFEDVTQAAGLDEDTRSFACWFFDFDNDGAQDLFVAGFAGSFLDDEEGGLIDIPAVRLGVPTARDGFPRLYRNQGDGTFVDVAGEMGLRRVILVMGANFGDIDGDGWLDLYLGTGKPDFRGLMANRMFRSDEGRAYQDVTTAGGFGHVQKGHGVSFGDVDNDGDQDVYAVMGGAFPSDDFPNVLFENPGHGSRWVTLRLEGQRSNRSAIGARLRVDLRTPSGERSIHRTVGTGGSFGSSSLQQEIGLGDASSIESIEITWPASGTRQRFSDVEMDRVYFVREGEDALVGVPFTPFELSPEGAGDAHAGHAH